MSSLPCSTRFISPPQTFNELNDRLQACVEKGSFQPLHLKNDEKALSQNKYLFDLNRVLLAMRFPIGAYLDVKEESIARWRELMIQLFPIQKMNETERKTFSLFCKNIPVYVERSLPGDPRTVVTYPGIPVTYDPFPHWIELYKLDAKERLELAMTCEHTPNGVEEKAKKLQVILCSLIFEQDLLFKSFEVSEIYYQYKHEKEFYHKDHKVIPVNFFLDHPFFAENDLANPEDPADLPFLLQIKSTMKTVATLLQQEKHDAVIKKLENLKATCPRWSVQIDRCLNLVKNGLLAKDYSIKVRAIGQFFDDYTKSLLFSDPQANFPHAENIVYPLTLWYMKKFFLINQVNGELESTPLTTKAYGKAARDADQLAIRKNCETWYALQPYQQALYKEAYLNLQELIGKHDLKNYNVRLFGDGNLPTELPPKTLPGIEALTPNYQGFFKIQKEQVEANSSEKPVSVMASPMVFDDCVTRWQNHPVNQPLSREIFGDSYADGTWEYQQQLIAYHSFSVLADRFYNFGIEETWLNPMTNRIDKHYIIAADLQRKDMPVERGMVILSVDPDNICYHKCFHQTKESDIYKTIIDECFYLPDFPTLVESMKITRDQEKKACQMSSEGETFAVDPILGSVTITNPRLDLKITLYRTSLI